MFAPIYNAVGSIHQSGMVRKLGMDPRLRGDDMFTYCCKFEHMMVQIKMRQYVS